MHVNPSTATFYKTAIVPNDPADFARNSFDSQTLNTVIKTLHHKSIHLLKLDTFVEDVKSFEVLRFLIDDSLLQSVQELHFVVRLGESSNLKVIFIIFFHGKVIHFIPK